MDWAHKRQWMVVSVLVAAVIALLLIFAFAVFYETPTCMDGRQNGEEEGVDCGGTCSTICTVAAEPARVRFARIIEQSGRNDLIAYIDNLNKDAYAADAHLIVDVYRKDGRSFARRVALPLPADASTPLYIPGIANAPVEQVFVSFEEGSPVWTKGQGWRRLPPKTVSATVGGTETAPRVLATIENQTAYDAFNAPFIATVFAADGSVIAASQTVVLRLPAQGSAQAIFTWNEPFEQPYARIEVVPLLELPRYLP